MKWGYVACLPWAVVVGAGVLQLARHAPAMLVAALSAAVALALGALTVRQTAVWRDSRHLWEHVLALDADNYFAYAGRGVVRQAEGDLQGALADFDAALRRNPGLARVYNNRCVVRIALGDIEAALADCDSALRVSARFADAHLNRGIAYQMRGDLDRALADYTQAIEDALDDARSGRRASLALARAHYGRGNIQMAAGDLDGAIASFTEALRNDPAYLEAYNDRGRARQLRRDEAGATEDFARARALSATRTP